MYNVQAAIILIDYTRNELPSLTHALLAASLDFLLDLYALVCG